MRRSLRHLAPLVVALAVVAASCSDDDEASDQVVETSSTTASSSTASSSTSTTTTTTEPFEGATTPTSIASGASAVALLTGVRVEASTVTFTFRDDVVPGVDAAYVDDVTADGSGEPVEVAGGAHLQVRMEPASGVDLSSNSGSFEETYTGPDRIDGPTPIVEVVRTGDFEANLTWVVGVADERPFRIEVGGSTVTVRVAP